MRSTSFVEIVMLSLAGAGCVPELDDDVSIVGDARVLAIVAEPPEAREGETVRLGVLVAGALESGVQPLLSFCHARKPLSELASAMTVYPQILVNVRGVDHQRLHNDEVIARAIADAEAELGKTGRVLLRPSGTEPMVRVMVEAADQATADRHAHVLAEVVREQLAR